jgi:hypothetical protein
MVENDASVSDLRRLHGARTTTSLIAAAWPEKMPRSGLRPLRQPSVLLLHDGSFRADDTLKYACAAADGFGWIPRIDRPVVVALLA